MRMSIRTDVPQAALLWNERLERIDCGWGASLGRSTIAVDDRLIVELALTPRWTDPSTL